MASSSATARAAADPSRSAAWIEAVRFRSWRWRASRSSSRRMTVARVATSTELSFGMVMRISSMASCSITSGSSPTEMKNPIHARNNRPSLANIGVSLVPSAAGAAVIGFSDTKCPTASAMRVSSACFRDRHARSSACSAATLRVFSSMVARSSSTRLLISSSICSFSRALVAASSSSALLEHPLEGVEGTIAPHGVLDDLLDLDTRRRRAPPASTCAALRPADRAMCSLCEHLRHLEHGVAVGRRRDLGRRVDVARSADGRPRAGRTRLAGRLGGQVDGRAADAAASRLPAERRPVVGSSLTTK